jgi:hypothetical protein
VNRSLVGVAARHSDGDCRAFVGGVRQTRAVASWDRLRTRLESVDGSVTFGWNEIDRLAGGLPPSAVKHRAFWSGRRSAWSGFVVSDVQVGTSVTFTRLASEDGRPPRTPAVAPTLVGPVPDVVLIGCVKSKRDRPAPARDLYTSPLFRKERGYAERSGARWFILSAEHGLLEPSTVVAPYDLVLSKTSREYRRDWGRRVVGQLDHEIGPLAGKVIEVRPGEAYAGAIRQLLRDAGADVREPMRGRSMGRRLAWHTTHPAPIAPSRPARHATATGADLAVQLADQRAARTPAELLATRDPALNAPGLYSWWVDDDGAGELSTGLGQLIPAGLIYAGLAGATRSRSGKKSGNTLWGRLTTMHLGGRHEFSTFRLSLGSILAAARGETDIDEHSLTEWMHAHLRVVTVPADDADSLDSVETDILAVLNPPLNLSKMAATDARRELTGLRRKYSRKRRLPARS